MTEEEELRKAARRPVTLPARCRTAGGMRDDAIMSDISAEGCCIATRSLHLNIGARVVLKPEGLEAVSGVVRWIAGQRVGIAFDTPLYGPIVDHLSERHKVGFAAR